jgi:hypothetical protein
MKRVSLNASSIVLSVVLSLAGASDSVSQTVDNQAPVAGVSGPTTGSPGQELAFTLTATDDAEDANAGFVFMIDWNDDGTVDETVPASPGNGAGVTVNHTFTQAGPMTFSVTAIDQHGGVSAPVAYDVDVIQSPSIEVLPGQVNLNGGGLVPVVLFSTADFDVATLDLESLQLSGATAVDSAFEDVDDDGDLDLVLYFQREDFLDAYAAALVVDLADGTLDDNHQEVELVLTGQTQDGADILGTAGVVFFMTGKKLSDLLETL